MYVHVGWGGGGGGEREAETTNLVFPLTRCAAEIILEGSPQTGDQRNHSNHWLIQ